MPKTWRMEWKRITCKRCRFSKRYTTDGEVFLQRRMYANLKLCLGCVADLRPAP